MSDNKVDGSEGANFRSIGIQVCVSTGFVTQRETLWRGMNNNP